MGLLENYWSRLSGSHRESERALFRTIFPGDSSSPSTERRLLPVDRGLAILMATLLMLASGHGSSKKASTLNERFSGLVQQFSAVQGEPFLV